MTDKELTMLAYLADALVMKPVEIEKWIKLAFPFPISAECHRIISNIKKIYTKHNPQDKTDVLALIKVLSSSSKKYEKQISKLLAWGTPYSHENICSPDFVDNYKRPDGTW